jgi:uncharacterized protein YerC
MKTLEKDWLTTGLLDFEYKKYVLLAYLKEVKKHFQERRLYPFLADLVFHYQNLVNIRENKKLIYENFPQVITKADFKKLEIVYKKVIKDDQVMQEIEEILGFAIPQVKKALDEGATIYEDVEQQINIFPIGLTPLYKNEGYLFFTVDMKKEMQIFRYQLSVFENSASTYRGINTQFIKKDIKSIGRTFEQIKLELIKKCSQLPNPATYLVVSKAWYPFKETLMPVAKRLLMQELARDMA